MLCYKCSEVGMLEMLTVKDIKRVELFGKKVYQMELKCPHCNSEYTWAAMPVESLKSKKKDELSRD